MLRIGVAGVICACLLAVAGAGCARIERAPVPAALASHARPQGLAYARFWGDEVPKDVVTFVQMHMPNVKQMAVSATREGNRPVVEYLALSGGADDGAFGAGLLVGWTKRGNRPSFEIVTGVSAGALIAPYAFLGPSYDAQLAELWTDFDPKMVATPQVLAGLLGAEAIADTTPLRELIARHVDRRMLRQIAREYRNGRLLMIGTTNLDAQRQVIWNMGEIAMAAGRDPAAAQLFRDVLLASASIPGLFPPVHVKVQVGDRTFEEMHVDGGATRQVFLAPAQFSLRTFDAFYPEPPIRKVYVVRNAKLQPAYEAVPPNVLAIGARSLTTVTKSQSIGDINHIYAMTQRDGAEFRLASIPMTFTQRSSQSFDPVYMKALFQVGYDLGRRGNTWSRQPPEAVSIATR
ncbi:MAG TPA: patatin-like phospholipase family protein [Hyphomicrobiaceae bacterium]|nr:patatin-like phospholipase family protein [Hyphomicrobiaceae bacterium]